MRDLSRLMASGAIDTKTHDMFTVRMEKLLAQSGSHCSSLVGATSGRLACGSGKLLCNTNSRKPLGLEVHFSLSHNGTIDKNPTVLEHADAKYVQKRVYRKSRVLTHQLLKGEHVVECNLSLGIFQGSQL